MAAQGFLKSWGMILVSEIGDKTFFIAAIMAMRHPRRVVRTHLRRRPLQLCAPPLVVHSKLKLPRQVFAGALGALAAMTALSAALGWAAPNLVSPAVESATGSVQRWWRHCRPLCNPPLSPLCSPRADI